MHLVLRSSHAKGEWSFRRSGNSRRVKAILEKFSSKYGVKIYSLANVGNHLHLHIRLGSRHGYKRFIRAVTASIVMAITGVSRWKEKKVQFWDLRPYTRVVIGRKAWAILVRYIRINQWEGFGVGREIAAYLVDRPRASSA